MEFLKSKKFLLWFMIFVFSLGIGFAASSITGFLIAFGLCGAIYAIIYLC